MTAEQIVRALAAAEPFGDCGLCSGGVWPEGGEHEPDCPWRLAVEWVAATDDRDPPEKTYNVALHLAFADRSGHGFTESGRATVKARSETEALVIAALAETAPDDYEVSAMPTVHEAPLADDEQVSPS